MVQDNIQPNTRDTSPPIQLAAEIGTEMQVELSSLGNRFKLILIGIVQKKYLLYHLPTKIAGSAGSSALKPETSINIRSISRGTAFGFNTSIIGTTNSPDTLLFVKYPKIIQQHTIRKNQRVKCLLPAKLFKDSVSISGTLADISTSGCHFQTKKANLSDKQVKLIQSDKILTVALALPGMGGDKQISALIKNIFTDSEKAQIGIQFKNIEDSTLRLIADFITMSFELPPF